VRLKSFPKKKLCLQTDASKYPLEPALWICADPSVVFLQFALDDLVELKTVRILAVLLKCSVIVNRTGEENFNTANGSPTRFAEPSRILDGPAERQYISSSVAQHSAELVP
jgi:hypothetical protein